MQALTPRHWHLFCRVIDNFGDVGVAWRLAAQLAEARQSVTLWIDDASALAWMAPAGHPGVAVRRWPDRVAPDAWPAVASVVVEMFGCALPVTVQQRIAEHPAALSWLNLEYLSAESYVERSHGLPSPVMSGPAQGRSKWFVYPGFTAATGGLLREPDLMNAQAAFDVSAWRRAHQASAHAATQGPWISLFCYEPAALAPMLRALSPSAQLLVTPGRAEQAVDAVQAGKPWPANWQALPTTHQVGFDHMLWACELNFVRGEDSLVRALWAGQAFIWQLYPQDDDAHADKLAAFLDWIQAPADWRQAHLLWNGLSSGPWPELSAARLSAWREVVQAARARLLQQDSLCVQLLRFVAAHVEPHPK